MALLRDTFGGGTPLQGMPPGYEADPTRSVFDDPTSATFITQPINPNAPLPEPLEFKLGPVDRATSFIAREVFGESGQGGNPTTALGKTVAGVRNGGDGSGVLGAFSEEYSRESERLYGFDMSTALGKFVKWAPFVIVAWLLATLFAPALSRSVVSGVKGAVA